MSGWLPRDGSNRWIEPLFALVVLAGLVEAMRSLLVYGHLPQPFFFEPGDAWMDWFNTTYWAYDSGTYDTWQTVYPPLSFVFLRLTSLTYCYAGIPGVAPGEGAIGWPTRDCDWLGAIIMHAVFILNIVLVGKVFLKIDRSTALFRSFVVAAGMPMLDALERGNLMMITFTCFLLAHGPLLRSARMRWLAIGLAVNFKVYLIASIFPYLIRRRWRWFEGALLSVIAIYILTWGLLGRGTPIEIYDNIQNFATAGQPLNLLDLWYASTYQPLLALLEGSIFPIVSVVGSGRVETFSFLLPLVTRIVQAMIVLAAASAALRPEAVPTHRLVNLVTGLAIVSAEAGGYTTAILIFMTLFERWRGIGPRWAIVMCYILSYPGDIYIDPLNPGVRPSFLYGPPIFYTYWVTFGPFIRPALILSIPLALSLSTMGDVWRDIRSQEWRNRWRFRNDLPILLGEGAAIAPYPEDLDQAT